MFSVKEPAALERFGFKFSKGGAHAAQTMMLSELQRLLQSTADGAAPDGYRQAVVDENLLDKPTVNARKLSFQHLVSLYALDLGTCFFRVFHG